MRKRVYKFISDTLAGIEGAPVKHIDLWNMQVSYAGEEPPFDTPAVFVEFKDIEWDCIGIDCVEECRVASYKAEVRVLLHIVTDSRVGKWSDALEAVDLADAISDALPGASSEADGIVGFVRVESITDTMFSELMHNVEAYSLALLNRP